MLETKKKGPGVDPKKRITQNCESDLKQSVFRESEGEWLDFEEEIVGPRRVKLTELSKDGEIFVLKAIEEKPGKYPKADGHIPPFYIIHGRGEDGEEIDLSGADEALLAKLERGRDKYMDHLVRIRSNGQEKFERRYFVALVSRRKDHNSESVDG